MARSLNLDLKLEGAPLLRFFARAGQFKLWPHAIRLSFAAGVSDHDKAIALPSFFEQVGKGAHAAVAFQENACGDSNGT